MSEKLRVLITGATGFVGGHLIRALDEEGPSALEIFGTAYPEVPPSGNKLFHLDLRSEKDVIGVSAKSGRTGYSTSPQHLTCEGLGR